METASIEKREERTKPVLSLPTRNGNSLFDYCHRFDPKGFEPTYKEWKLPENPLPGVKNRHVLSLPTRNGNGLHTQLNPDSVPRFWAYLQGMETYS